MMLSSFFISIDGSFQENLSNKYGSDAHSTRDTADKSRTEKKVVQVSTYAWCFSLPTPPPHPIEQCSILSNGIDDGEEDLSSMLNRLG